MASPFLYRENKGIMSLYIIQLIDNRKDPSMIVEEVNSTYSVVILVAGYNMNRSSKVATNDMMVVLVSHGHKPQHVTFTLKLTQFRLHPLVAIVKSDKRYLLILGGQQQQMIQNHLAECICLESLVQEAVSQFNDQQGIKTIKKQMLTSRQLEIREMKGEEVQEGMVVDCQIEGKRVQVIFGKKMTWTIGDINWKNMSLSIRLASHLPRLFPQGHLCNQMAVVIQNHFFYYSSDDSQIVVSKHISHQPSLLCSII